MQPRRYILLCFVCYGGGLFDDPLVYVPRAHRFGATNMSACTAPLYGRDVIADLSGTYVRLSGAANLWHARVGHLLAKWSVCSLHCKARWEQATVEVGHKVVCAAEDAAIREHAESLITPLGAVELVVALKAPKPGFHTLSEFFTRQCLQHSLKTRRPFSRPICTREAFDAEWPARSTPLQVAPPVAASSPPSSVVAHRFLGPLYAIAQRSAQWY